MASGAERASRRRSDADRQVSSLYRTPPWGKTDQPDFLNAAAEIATGAVPRAMLGLCLDAERRLKRVRAERWGPRLIDIDMLVFGDRRIDEPASRCRIRACWSAPSCWCRSPRSPPTW